MGSDGGLSPSTTPSSFNVIKAKKGRGKEKQQGTERAHVLPEELRATSARQSNVIQNKDFVGKRGDRSGDTGARAPPLVSKDNAQLGRAHQGACAPGCPDRAPPRTARSKPGNHEPKNQEPARGPNPGRVLFHLRLIPLTNKSLIMIMSRSRQRPEHVRHFGPSTRAALRHDQGSGSPRLFAPTLLRPEGKGMAINRPDPVRLPRKTKEPSEGNQVDNNNKHTKSYTNM